jgi:hypothetical protein
MTYNQYTTCIDAQLHNKSNPFVQATVAATTFVAPLAVMAALLSPWCALLLVPIFMAAWTLTYCDVFLHDRLICLPPPADPICPGRTDVVAIGMVVDILAPVNNSGFTAVDTDYSVGILLAPNLPGPAVQDDPTQALVDRQLVEESVPYGYLMKEQDATKNIGLPFTSHLATDNQTGEESWVLHCEFEGAGVRDLQVASVIALALAVAALFVCVLVPGPIGFFLVLLLAFFAFLVLWFGFLLSVGDEGSPADTNPSLGGELHIGRIYVVMGSWVYDSGHNYKGPFSTLGDSDSGGWNEIHPIKFCTYVDDFYADPNNPGWPANIVDLEAHWSTMLCDSTSTGTLENQKQPQNQWHVHPIIDGCQPAVVIV